MYHRHVNISVNTEKPPANRGQVWLLAASARAASAGRRCGFFLDGFVFFTGAVLAGLLALAAFTFAGAFLRGTVIAGAVFTGAFLAGAVIAGLIAVTGGKNRSGKQYGKHYGQQIFHFFSSSQSQPQQQVFFFTGP